MHEMTIPVIPVPFDLPAVWRKVGAEAFAAGLPESPGDRSREDALANPLPLSTGAGADAVKAYRQGWTMAAVAAMDAQRPEVVPADEQEVVFERLSGNDPEWGMAADYFGRTTFFVHWLGYNISTGEALAHRAQISTSVEAVEVERWEKDGKRVRFVGEPAAPYREG